MATLIPFLTLIILFEIVLVIKGEPLVPALFAFGDSIIDVGNNNYLQTLVKANFFPYGRDFVNHSPTGRFSNGKVAADYASEVFRFNSYQPTYLNLVKERNNLLIGANFASAATGYHPSTPIKYNVLSLGQQLEYYKEYQKELVKTIGQSKALSVIYGSIYFVVAGNSDFVLNYYVDPFLQTIYTPYQFSDILLQYYFNFIQDLYALGARKIGVSTLPPIGCMPIVITFYGFPYNTCVEKINDVAIDFNKKLNLTSTKLLKKFPDLKLIILDIYQPLYKLSTKPSDYGFLESRKACCGTGLVEVTFACNSISIGTCANASEYVFWDSFHPTQATHKYLIDHLTPDLISFIQT
ncbi:GDSL esterase/lipase At5g22810-like [Vicia villosa]|uniref:GDSL esterase/lipase At5g22810-like n=1 Tax=Vicia villosa TaxID=3911 RepID=UPI00273A8DB1|nr:GDSL esterase/lipase At5g22810-like [Vicia villosa]